ERALLGRAAAWHLAHDDLVPAVRYLADAAEWDQLVEVATAHGRQGVAHAAEVATWLGPMPAEELDRRPRARLVAAAAATLAGDTATSGDLLDALEACLPASGGQRATVALLRAYWELRQ